MPATSHQFILFLQKLRLPASQNAILRRSISQNLFVDLITETILRLIWFIEKEPTTVNMQEL